MKKLLALTTGLVLVFILLTTLGTQLISGAPPTQGRAAALTAPQGACEPGLLLFHLNRDDSLIRWNELGENIQESGFTGTGTARNDDIQSGFYTGFQELQRLRSNCIEFDQLFDRYWVLKKFSDRQYWSYQGDGRDNSIHT